MSTNPYTILAEGLFTEAEVELSYDPVRHARNLSNDAGARVGQQWDQAMTRARLQKKQLYNSPLFRLAGVDAGGGSPLGLQLGDTDYREYLASRAHPDETPRADPLGTAIIVVTADGQVPIGKRSEQVEVNPGRYFTFGGFFDRELDWEPASHRPSLFGCARRELQEELGIDVPVDDLRLLGIIYDHVHPHPEACFLAPFPAPGAELLRSLGAEEVSDLTLVPLAGLSSFVEQEASRICESLRGGFEAFLRLLGQGARFGSGPAWEPLGAVRA